MWITLSPTRDVKPLKLSVEGETITANGETIDLSGAIEGEPLSVDAWEWLASDVERIDGELHLTIRFPHGPNAPEASRFPEPIHVTQDGRVDLPPF